MQALRQKTENFLGLSDKMCVCYRRVAGLDVAFLDAD